MPRHLLPYAFAKSNTLLLEDDGTQLTLYSGETTPSTALSTSPTTAAALDSPPA